jgi:hypothetical protein
MDELTLIKARALVEEIRHYNAEAERDTVQYGGWQCDYTSEVVKCQKELDKLLALSPAPSVPEGMERELIAARDRIAGLEAAAAWRPISEAPRDGLVLIAVGDLVGEGFFMDDPSRNHWGLTGWFFLEDNVLCDKPSFPTHFRPLPAAPTTPIAEGGE